MSYSIVFQTKIVKLPDGRLIHLNRIGCNNDNEGRNKREFNSKIYTENDFINYAEGFKEGSKPSKETDGWDLKIGSKYSTYYDYGEHLLRMLKRAENWEDFIHKHKFCASYCDGIEVFKPEHKIVPLKDIDKFFSEHTDFTYRRIMKHFDKLEDIIQLFDENRAVEFYII